MILVGVNFASEQILKQFVEKWTALSDVSHVVIVDCFSSKEELMRVQKMCNSSAKCTLTAMDNVGYGAALNAGLDKVVSLSNHSNLNERELVLFGNVDVFPRSIKTQEFDERTIPIINIYENGRQRNPFLTSFQSHFLWITRLASKYNSGLILDIWKSIYRITKFIPLKKVYAVHGAIFGLQIRHLKLCCPIFDPRVFLYCEELFFARAVHRAGLTFDASDISVEHVGSVSTSETIKKDQRAFFANWCKSNNTFFGIDENKA